MVSMIVGHLIIQMNICLCVAHFRNIVIAVLISSNARMANASMHHWLVIITMIVAMQVMKLDVVNLHIKLIIKSYSNFIL